MLDDAEQKIVDDIAAFGWHFIRVRGDAKGPGFVYSIGLMTTFNHPEVILFGLKPEVMGEILQVIVEDIRAGRSFGTPGLYEGLVERFALKFLPVSNSRHAEYLGYAMWHRRYLGQVGTLEAVQCLWPDKSGRFPDERECADGCRRAQPLLA